MTEKSKSNFSKSLSYIFAVIAIGVTSLLFFADAYASVAPKIKLEQAILANFANRKLIYGITILPICVASLQFYKNKSLALPKPIKLYKLITKKTD